MTILSTLATEWPRYAVAFASLTMIAGCLSFIWLHLAWYLEPWLEARMQEDARANAALSDEVSAPRQRNNLHAGRP